MSGIGKIGGVNITPVAIDKSSRINPAISGVNTPNTQGIKFEEKFDFPSIALDERDAATTTAEERINYKIFLELFIEIIRAKVDIVPTLPKDHGGYITEASFKPSQHKDHHHEIHAPLRGVTETLKAPNIPIFNSKILNKITHYVDSIFDHSTDNDILRLVIVISHEFGHFLSFSRGNHNNELRHGIYLLHSKQTSPQLSKYTLLVLREENVAWNYGSDILKRNKFDFWEYYKLVKFNSLQVYFKELKLEHADLQTYYQLSSMFEEDLQKLCQPSSFSHFKKLSHQSTRITSNAYTK